MTARATLRAWRSRGCSVCASSGVAKSREELRGEHQRVAETIKAALERILWTGCLVKDLDMGLLDFPAVIDKEEVYLCWKLGEDRIRFYHRQDEGYAGRKPLDPRDLGPADTVQ